MSKAFTEFKKSSTSSSNSFVGYNDPVNKNIQISFDNLKESFIKYTTTNTDIISSVSWIGLDEQESLSILNPSLNQFTYSILLSSSVKNLTLNFGPLNISSATLKINHGSTSNQITQLSSFTASVSSSRLSGSDLGINQTTQFIIRSLERDNLFTLFVQASTPNSILLTLTPTITSAEAVDLTNIPSTYFTEPQACRAARRLRDNTYTGLLNSIDMTINSVLQVASVTNTVAPSSVNSDEWFRVLDCLQKQMPILPDIESAASLLRDAIAYPSSPCSNNVYPFVFLRSVLPKVRDISNTTLNINLTACDEANIVALLPVYFPAPFAMINLVDKRLEDLVLGEYLISTNSENCSC